MPKKSRKKSLLPKGLGSFSRGLAFRKLAVEAVKAGKYKSYPEAVKAMRKNVWKKNE